MSTLTTTTALTNGVEIPTLGFGTWQVPDGPATYDAVAEALRVGYRHIDTAAGYYNEEGVGAALRATDIPRDEIFVTTKLRNGDQGYDTTLAAFEASRAALDLEYVDLFLIHWPVPSLDLYVETWRAFEKLQADGLVRSIGVSNFLPEHLDRLVAETEIVPSVNQIEVHPTFQQADLQAATRAHGIAVQAYSPLGRGTDLEAPAVVDAAQRLGVSPAQVVLRWHLQAGRIVIPKSVTAERIRANIDVLGFELTDADVAAIDALESGNRLGADPATATFTQYRD